MSTNNLHRYFSEIDSIPWDRLKGAYGFLTNAPESLRALAGDDEDEVEEAIFGFLHSEACHQYTTYSCTPYVVRCVLLLLKLKSIDDKKLSEILGFIRACSNSAREKEDLKVEIVSGQEIYLMFHRKEGRLGDESRILLNFCKEHC